MAPPYEAWRPEAFGSLEIEALAPWRGVQLIDSVYSVVTLAPWIKPAVERHQASPKKFLNSGTKKISRLATGFDFKEIGMRLNTMVQCIKEAQTNIINADISNALPHNLLFFISSTPEQNAKKYLVLEWNRSGVELTISNENCSKMVTTVGYKEKPKKKKN